MPAQQLFYATADDMLPALLRVDRIVTIKYAVAGSSDQAIFPEFRPCTAIPRFGVVDEDDWNLTPCYMVMDATQRVKMEKVKQHGGGIKYVADANKNRNVLLFSPSGIYQDRAIICGKIGRTDSTQVARQLYKLFVGELLRGFSRVSVYWIGASAMCLLRSGWRFTPSLRWSNEADLRIINPPIRHTGEIEDAR